MCEYNVPDLQKIKTKYKNEHKNRYSLHYLVLLLFAVDIEIRNHYL